MSDILELASEGRAEELWLQMRRRALCSLFYFAKVVCAYSAIDVDYHMPLCNDLQNTIAERKRGYLWPRGHFKSTVIAKAYPHWRLCGGGLVGKSSEEDILSEIMSLKTEELLQFYKQFPEKDPRNLRIGIVGESQDVANKDLKDIKDRTTESDLFKWLFPEIVPEDIRKTKWTESEIVLPRSKSFDESSITCMGVGAKKTGFHYDIIIYDDIIGLEASKSEPVMEAALEWLRFAPGMLNDPERSEELIAGTRWKDGTADVYGWFMKNLPYTAGVYNEKGEMLVPPQGYKFSTQSCYIEPTKEVRFRTRFTQFTLEQIRQREGDYRFNCNYRNTPTPPEGAQFAKIKFYTVQNDPDGLPRIAVPEDGTPPVHINQMARNSFYDPSAGGKSAQAENAIAVVGTAADNRHFLLDDWSANCGYAGAIEHWHKLNDKYRCWKNAYEQVGHQKEVGEIVSMRSLYGTHCIFCQGQHKLLVPTGVQPPNGVHKYDRIKLFLGPEVDSGRVYIRRDHAEMSRQAEMFPNGDLVDRLDAFAYAVHEAIPYRGIDEEMDSREQQKQAVAARSPRTNTSRSYGGYL